MRPALVAIVGAIALAPRDSAALSYPRCSSCIARVLAVSATSVDLAAALGTTVPNAATTECLIKYRVVAPTYNTKRMTKTASSFTVSIVALPPSKTLDFQMVCDGGAGPFFPVTTTARAGPPPKHPAIVAATRVGDTVQFDFSSDPSEPTVFWPELRTGASPWHVLDDREGTFPTKKIDVSASLGTTIRLVVRNSAGIVYSAAVP